MDGFKRALGRMGQCLLAFGVSALGSGCYEADELRQRRADAVDALDVLSELDGNACGSACITAGAIECDASGGIRVCELLPSGCLQWSAATPCDDGDPCTDDGCDADGCTTTLNTATCDDGIATTQDDVCAAGVCAGTPYDCILGTCEESSTHNGVDCTVVLSAAGTACDDGDTTTSVDVCDDAGTCAGTPLGCVPTECQAASTPNGEGCDVTYEALGTICDDGVAATQDDLCDGAGGCAGTAYACTPTQCEASSEPNGVDCDIVYKDDGETCDDGDPATATDVCDGAGVCAGTVLGCTPTQCQETSIPNGVDCDITFKADGTTCSDGDDATNGDACDGDGACIGTPYSCVLGTCETSSVVNGVDCTIVYDGVGTACDDADTTTNTDVCDGAGGCAGTPYTCTPAICESTSTPNGTDCSITYDALGTACDDSDATTQNDQCDGAGGCAGTPYVCTPGVCEATSVSNGIDCTVTYQAAGSACDDGDNDTATDVCDATGGCAGTPYVCTPAVCVASSVSNGVDCTITYDSDGTSCTDGDDATHSDVCDGSGGCAGTPFTCTPGICEDASVPNGVDCTITYTASGTTCDDSTLATFDDVCDGAGGCAGTSYTCTPNQCEDSSTPNGIDCDIVNTAAGTACDDGSATTGPDSCDGSGQCVGVPIACTPGVCELSSTPNGVDCTVVYEGAGAICDDGNLATNNDVCNGSGSCSGTPYACALGTCEDASVPNGIDCTITYSANATACDDGNLGTNNDVCDGSGSCSGTPYACAPTQCQDSSVTNGTDCDIVNTAIGSPCDDGSTATGADTCDGAGQCTGVPIVCTPGVCELSSTPNGVDCTIVYAGAGAVCDDGNLGTNSDVCNGSGSCSGTPYACTPGVCEDASVPNGTDCTITYSTNSTPCDDGLLDTHSDQCNGAGACGGTPYVCTPNQCQNSSVPNGTDCDITNFGAGTPCDDGSAATGSDTCDGAGQCSGVPIVCTPGVCELSSTPNGVDCTVIFAGPGTSCNDGDVGTNNDVCNGAGTCSGTPYTCSPGVCEVASTPNGVGCTPTYSPNGTSCNDGVITTNNDQCNGAGTCSGTPYSCSPGTCQVSSIHNGVNCTIVFSPGGVSCNDGNPGTNNDVCNGSGACFGTPYTCSPGVCEVASTPNGVGCTPTYSPNGTSCNDGIITTNNDQCNGAGTCSGTPYSCNPGTCQVSSTHNGTGCTVINSPNGTLCGSQNPCNSATACQNGSCVAGSPNSCGNGSCQASCSENTSTCPADCQSPGTPGDGTCGYLENACNSYDDCVTGTPHNITSCAGNCGNQGSPGWCSCDPACENFNDCCPDKQPLCGCTTNLP